MAKETKQEEEKKAPSTDFVKLVKEAVPSLGLAQFTRVNLKMHVTDAGVEALNEVYAKEGYEVFSNGKSVLLLKQ